MKEGTGTPASGQATERLLYDRRSAAAALSVSVRTIDNFLAQGEFKIRRIGRRVLIPRAELLRFARGDHFTVHTEVAHG